MAEKPRAPTNVFSVEFDTKTMPGKIIATTIELRRKIVSDPKAVFRIDLRDHPLYPALVRYVLSNPLGGPHRE